jgi:hypothetical protein
MRVDSGFPFGRWESRGCAERHPVACRAANGSWLVTAAAVPERVAATQCRARSAELAAPRTGYENQLLRVAMERAGASTAWLGYRRAPGEDWAPA